MGTVLLAGGGFTPAHAQDPDDLKRGVARISLMNGEVSVRRGDTADWVAGVINAPLLAEDRVATGPNSRTEVQFDSSNMLRLGANAELRLTQLEYNRFQMELARGMVTYRVLRNGDANVEIDTPSISVRPTRLGSVRIAVNEGGDTEVTARGGDVEIFTPRGSQWIRSGQTLKARGSQTDAEFQVVAADGMDDWDRWNDARDRQLLQSISARNVGPGVYGAEDLDNAGTWTSVPEYGNVWRPTVADDWSPYHNGRWVWEDWYGWTWVSYDPWGWAPYHYGRWFNHASYGWCWYPGAFGVRHYWSPALVAFFGFGGGGGFGFGFGNVGWVPLAPYEVFRPWWGRGYYGSRNYGNRSLNITNINISNTYRNARVRNGINGVGAHDFQNGRFNSIMRVNGNQVRDAGLVRGQMPFTPNSANTRFSDRQVTNVPRSSQNARFFTHQQPTPVQRMQQNQQVGGSQAPANRAQEPARAPQGSFRGNPGSNQGGNQGNQNQGNQNDGSGWRRFGSPSGQPGNSQGSVLRSDGNGVRGTGQNQIMRNDARNDRQAPSVNQAPRNDNRGGWQRFGSPGGSNNAPPQQPQQSAPAAPRQEYRNNPRSDGNSQPYNQRYNQPSGGYSRQESLRMAPPVVRERPSAPSYSAPRQSAPSYNAPRQSAPSYNAPRQSAPSYNAPRQSAPSYSAPRSNGGGGGGNSAPRGNSGGGGGHQSGGGGGHGNRGR
jgi:hypothetical protein